VTGDAPTPAEPREEAAMEALRTSIEAARKRKSRELLARILEVVEPDTG